VSIARVGLSIWPFSKRMITAWSSAVRSAKSEILRPSCSRSARNAARTFRSSQYSPHSEDCRDVAAVNQVLEGRFFLLEALAKGLLLGHLHGCLHSGAVNTRSFLVHDDTPPLRHTCKQLTGTVILALQPGGSKRV
jgi:hypothetical protein